VTAVFNKKMVVPKNLTNFNETTVNITLTINQGEQKKAVVPFGRRLLEN